MAKVRKRKVDNRVFRVVENKKYSPKILPKGDYIMKIADVEYDAATYTYDLKYTLDSGRLYYGKYHMTNSNGEDNPFIINLLGDIAQKALKLNRKPNYISEEIMKNCIGHFIVVTIIHREYNGTTYDLFKNGSIDSADSFDDDIFVDEDPADAAAETSEALD